MAERDRAELHGNVFFWQSLYPFLSEMKGKMDSDSPPPIKASTI
jgi:hypothetical protein